MAAQQEGRWPGIQALHAKHSRAWPNPSLNRTDAHARAESLRLLVLDTQSGSPAERLYLRLGWQRAGAIPGYALSPAGLLHATTLMFKDLAASWEISAVDPQGEAALVLLHAAWIEASALYADRATGPPGAPPGNPPAVPGSVYLIAWRDGVALGCAALQPPAAGDAGIAELRRLFVRREARRQGLAQALLARIEQEARALGLAGLRLETGDRQLAAQALYLACGWQPIEAFGPHAGDPTSRCFGKWL